MNRSIDMADEAFDINIRQLRADLDVHHKNAHVWLHVVMTCISEASRLLCIPIDRLDAMVLSINDIVNFIRSSRLVNNSQIQSQIVDAFGEVFR